MAKDKEPEVSLIPYQYMRNIRIPMSFFFKKKSIPMSAQVHEEVYYATGCISLRHMEMD
jgi:hypothetical protein